MAKVAELVKKEANVKALAGKEKPLDFVGNISFEAVKKIADQYGLSKKELYDRSLNEIT